MTYRLLHALLSLTARLPLAVLYAVSTVAAWVLRCVVRYRRTYVRRNLAAALPHLTEKERRDVERAFYRHLTDTVVETVKLLHISDEEMQRRVSVTGTHLMEQAADEGRPVFLFIGHIGNWEWVQEITRRISRPTVHGELYRPLHNSTFDRLMADIRTTHYPTQLIPMKQAVRTILRMRRDHGTFLVGFIGDQRPTLSSMKHWMTFLHQDTPYMVGGEEIGRHVDAKFLMLRVTKQQRGHYRMDILDMQLPEGTETGKDSYPYVELYMRQLEQNVVQQPELYLWSHNRWKFRRQTLPDGTWRTVRTVPRNGSIEP